MITATDYIKKVFNLETELNSDDFIANKQDVVSQEVQGRYSDYLCKVYTYCVPDKKFVIHTTEENKAIIGAADKILAHKPVTELSILSLDKNMLNTWEINIKADSTIGSYQDALDIAQAKADEMLENDSTRIPIVTLVDYKWNNPVAHIFPSAFGEIDDNGNVIPPAFPAPEVTGGNPGHGNDILTSFSNAEEFLTEVMINNPQVFTLVGDDGSEVTIDVPRLAQIDDSRICCPVGQIEAIRSNRHAFFHWEASGCSGEGLDYWFIYSYDDSNTVGLNLRAASDEVKACFSGYAMGGSNFTKYKDSNGNVREIGNA